MNKDLILAIEALEKENGISKEVMFDAIEKSLMDEYKAEFDKADNGRVSLDRITGDLIKIQLSEWTQYFSTGAVDFLQPVMNEYFENYPSINLLLRVNSVFPNRSFIKNVKRIVPIMSSAL